MDRIRAEQLRRGAARVDGMARALGADLQEAALCCRLRPSDLADAVLRCADCPAPGDCAARLADPAHAAPLPPSYCRNLALLGGARAAARERRDAPTG